MGATVESCTLAAEWTGEPNIIKTSTYSAMSVMQSYLKFILATYPDKKVMIVNYGNPSMFIYHAIHFVENIWGIINIGFPTYSVDEDGQHIRGVGFFAFDVFSFPFNDNIFRVRKIQV